MVCNNAGVGGGGGIDDISLATRRWVLDVNLMGVLQGIRTFLLHIRAHDQPYSVSKFVAVNISERLAKQLAPLGIGVTDRSAGIVSSSIARMRNREPENPRVQNGQSPLMVTRKPERVCGK